MGLAIVRPEVYFAVAVPPLPTPISPQLRGKAWRQVRLGGLEVQSCLLHDLFVSPAPVPQEMFYRHLYANAKPTLQQRVESWDNYRELFGVILNSNLNMQLPNGWLWDMVDEFVYQFQSFCQYRSVPQCLLVESPERI